MMLVYMQTWAYTLLFTQIGPERGMPGSWWSLGLGLLLVGVEGGVAGVWGGNLQARLPPCTSQPNPAGTPQRLPL